MQRIPPTGLADRVRHPSSCKASRVGHSPTEWEPSHPRLAAANQKVLRPTLDMALFGEGVHRSGEVQPQKTGRTRVKYWPHGPLPNLARHQGVACLSVGSIPSWPGT